MKAAYVKNSAWSEEELFSSVEAYCEMLSKFRLDQHFTKKDYYRALSKKFARTEKSFEYRMQNISYVLSLIGREWLPGLKPAKNVGAKNATKIEAMLAQVESKHILPMVAFEVSVREEMRKPSLPQPPGNIIPSVGLAEVSIYQRDARVKAWVLREAQGICEGCEHPAPFSGTDGIPYLEIHHIRQLADGGSDTVTNSVALCPNCHREMHYGVNRDNLASKIYGRIARLIPE